MTISEQKSFKRFCDVINKQLETEKEKEIVTLATEHLRNGMIDKYFLITQESVKQMLILHIATLPIFEALFGDKAKYNPITMILNQATNEVLNIDDEVEK